MKIQLLSTKNILLQFFPLSDNFDESKLSDEIKNIDKFGFDFEVDFPEEAPDKFVVIIHAELTRKDDYLLQTVFVSEFSTGEKKIDQKFKDSKFPYINAPAIAYPFLRSFIANTLTNCGWEPHYLPSVNFQKLYDDEQKKKENR